MKVPTSWLGLALIALPLAAQSPAFEVASVKLAAPQTGHMQYHMTENVDGQRVQFINASLTDLIGTAFRLQGYQLQGPAWMPAQKFDLEANMPAGATRDQIPDMLQALLRQRFQLDFHHTTKTADVATLERGAGELKLQPSPSGAEASAWTRTAGPDGSLHIDTKNMTLPELATLVSHFLGSPVVDQTGLDGRYDVPLDFSATDVANGSRFAGVAAGPAGDGSTGVFASLRALGFKVGAGKLPVDLIVVDHLEKLPSGN